LSMQFRGGGIGKHRRGSFGERRCGVNVLLRRRRCRCRCRGVLPLLRGELLSVRRVLVLVRVLRVLVRLLLCLRVRLGGLVEGLRLRLRLELRRSWERPRNSCWGGV
jgi:hypothetical protein